MTTGDGEQGHPEPVAEAIAVSCVSHFGITVSNIDASVDFYTRIMGFARKYVDPEEGWTRVGLALSDIILELFTAHPAGGIGDNFDPFYPERFGCPKIALTVPDAEAAYTQAVAAGVIPKCPITVTSVSKFFFITDPDGTPIQLQEFSGGRRRLTELFG